MIMVYWKKQIEKFVSNAVWLMRLVRPWLRNIGFITVANALMSCSGVAIASLNKYVVDAATRQRPVFDVKMFALLVIATIGVAFLSGMLGILNLWWNEKYSFFLKQDFYHKILHTRWSGLSGMHSGDIMTRLTDDVNTVASGLFSVLPSAVYIIFQLLSAFLVLYHWDPMLAIFAIVIGPVGALISIPIGKVFARYQRMSRENESAYRSFLQESIEKLLIVKSFGLERNNEERMQDFWHIRYDIIRKRSFAGMGVSMGVNSIFSLGYLFAFGWGLMRMSRGEVTYGTVTLLITLVGQLQTPVSGLQSLVQQMVSVLVSAGRMKEIAELPEEKYTDMQGVFTADQELGIRMEQVDFSYHNQGKTLIHHLNIDIKPGQVIGIVGESGVGKTTLVRLLLGLLCPDQGKMCLYDSTGKEDILDERYRRIISYVPQGNTLLSGTIRENLCMGKAGATEEQLWKALQMAEAETFVKEAVQGLDTVILEGGNAVSEGQAQRIAIARALLKPAAILILDEATASLDRKTESRIIENLRTGTLHVTCIVITHRLSLLRICDKTYQMRKGNLELVEENERK